MRKRATIIDNGLPVVILFLILATILPASLPLASNTIAQPIPPSEDEFALFNSGREDFDVY